MRIKHVVFSFIQSHNHFEGVFDLLVIFIYNIYILNMFFKLKYALDNR